MKVNEAIRILTDEAIRRGAECNDTNGIVRQLVGQHGLGFNTWFCVCCEIANRDAQTRGFANSAAEAAHKVFGSTDGETSI
jgi:hypothetical protein